MRIGANGRIGIGNRRLGGVAFEGSCPQRSRRAEDDAREILDIDLMHDTRARRNDSQTGERRLAPLEKRVPFAIALELKIRVLSQRVVRSKVIGLHRMIDHQLDRLQRIDCLGIAAHLRHCVPHRR